jgi:hypothetical protein
LFVDELDELLTCPPLDCVLVRVDELDELPWRKLLLLDELPLTLLL